VESARTTTTSCWFGARTCIAALVLSSLVLPVSARQQSPVPGPPEPLPGRAAPLPQAPSLVAWSIDIPAAPLLAPLITDTAVVVAHLPGVVAAYHRADGRLLWRAELEAVQPLAADGPLLYVAAGAAIHALRLADGSKIWSVPTDTLSAPPVAQDGWLLTAAGGSLTARRAADGTAVWTVDSGELREAGVIAGDMLVVPVADGRVVARDLLSGAVRWERRIGGAPGPPAVIGGAVFVGGSDRIFYCLDAATGEIDWRSRVGARIRGRATADSDRVFFAALDNLVRALDRWHGAVRWQTPVSFRPLTGALASGAAVFVAGPNQDVRILRAATGAPAGTLTFPGRLAVEPGFAYSADGAVFAAITGNLEESWKLSLTYPVPVASAPPPR
jgi:outer membrane protein assembly factor BamB